MKKMGGKHNRNLPNVTSGLQIWDNVTHTWFKRFKEGRWVFENDEHEEHPSRSCNDKMIEKFAQPSEIITVWRSGNLATSSTYSD